MVWSVYMGFRKWLLEFKDDMQTLAGLSWPSCPISIQSLLACQHSSENRFRFEFLSLFSALFLSPLLFYDSSNFTMSTSSLQHCFFSSMYSALISYSYLLLCSSSLPSVSIFTSSTLHFCLCRGLFSYITSTLTYMLTLCLSPAPKFISSRGWFVLLIAQQCKEWRKKESY